MSDMPPRSEDLSPANTASGGAYPAQPQAPAGANVATRGRIEIIDIARAVALFAMAIYHFTWDLEHFSYVEHGLTGSGGWRIFARTIASSFLFLVGVSLVLAHGRQIRWRSFLKRLSQVAAGALAVTIVTLFATPNSFVYFGILQQIVVASLLGLLFLRLPWWLTAVAAVLAVALPHFVASPLLDPKWLNWIGLFRTPPVSNDFVPIFPFFGAVLAGIAVSRFSLDHRVFDRLRMLNDRLRALNPLGALGRHSLLFYLLHQPILYGLVFGASVIVPPNLHTVLKSDCQRACRVDRDPAFCQRYCVCVETELTARNLFDALMGDDTSSAQKTQIHGITNECSFRSEE